MNFDGILFPVTPFRHDGAIDHELRAQHIDQGVGSVFPECGTGEFHALSAPLVDPTPDRERRLAAILDAGRALL